MSDDDSVQTSRRWVVHGEEPRICVMDVMLMKVMAG